MKLRNKFRYSTQYSPEVLQAANGRGYNEEQLNWIKNWFNYFDQLPPDLREIARAKYGDKFIKFIQQPVFHHITNSTTYTW